MDSSYLTKSIPGNSFNIGFCFMLTVVRAENKSDALVTFWHSYKCGIEKNVRKSKGTALMNDRPSGREWNAGTAPRSVNRVPRRYSQYFTGVRPVIVLSQTLHTFRALNDVICIFWFKICDDGEIDREFGYGRGINIEQQRTTKIRIIALIPYVNYHSELLESTSS